MANCIIAYTGEGEHFAPLLARATTVARERSARLIIYHADAASRLGANPLPTWWSGDGAEEQFGNRLGPVELEKAGHEELRDRVTSARAQGIDAYGWLPSSRGAKDLATYAEEQGADLLIVPSDLETKGLGDWLKGQPKTDEVIDETHLPVMVVELDGKSSGERAE